MLVPSVLLLVIGVLGAVDVLVFHHLIERLPHRAETRAEAWAHVAKAPVYAVLFLAVPNLELRGGWVLPLLGWMVLDVAVAAWDVALEPRARRSRGGLTSGEYALHVTLSVLAGAFLVETLRAVLPHLDAPAHIALSPAVPLAVRVALAVLAAGVLAVAAVEVAALAGAGRRADLGALLERALRTPPVHVAIELPMARLALWQVLQDHVAQPRWDHRFSRIAPRGAELDYDTFVGPLVLRGWGRVALERAGRQSTFLFGSEQVMNPIRRGSGVWLLRDLPRGGVRFATSYTYEPRWGLAGRVLDALVLRWWFQRETERSFRRLAAMLGHRVAVSGAVGRKPARRGG